MDEYYERVLASLDERRARAVEHRAELIAAQADATKAEWLRRRAEVTEELTPTVDTHPFRLHVLEVPAYEVLCVVRRGTREYPLPLTYVQATASFLAPQCPFCGASTTLIAGKERLGCRSCLGGNTEPARPAVPGISTVPTGAGLPVATSPIGVPHAQNVERGAAGGPAGTNSPTGTSASGTGASGVRAAGAGAARVSAPRSSEAHLGPRDTQGDKNRGPRSRRPACG